MLFSYQKYIAIGAAALLVLGVITALHLKIKNKDLEIAGLNIELVSKEVTITKLESSNREYKVLVGVQNDAVDMLAVDMASANKKLKEWKAKPAEVRYETIYKISEVKSNECIDIKGTISHIRGLDYSSL